MTDTERLAALLHEQFAWAVWCDPDFEDCEMRDGFIEHAARLIAQGVRVGDPPREDAGGLRAALEIVTDALDSTAEDAHAGWAYYGGSEQTSHSGPDDFNTCLDSQCRRRQRYVADARAALAAQPAPPALDVHPESIGPTGLLVGHRPSVPGDATHDLTADPADDAGGLRAAALNLIAHSIPSARYVRVDRSYFGDLQAALAAQPAPPALDRDALERNILSRIENAKDGASVGELSGSPVGEAIAWELASLLVDILEQRGMTSGEFAIADAYEAEP